MSYVEVRSGDARHSDHVTNALQELKKKMKKENTLNDLKKYEAHMPPSEKKRFRRNEARKRRKRDGRKQDWFEKNNEMKL